MYTSTVISKIKNKHIIVPEQSFFSRPVKLIKNSNTFTRCMENTSHRASLRLPNGQYSSVVLRTKKVPTAHPIEIRIAIKLNHIHVFLCSIKNVSYFEGFLSV